MNIIVAIIFGLKRVPECIKMHHFEGEHAKIFLGTPPHWEGGYPLPIPQLVGTFSASIRVPSALDWSTPETTFLDTGLLVQAV